jgi:hypothetical protein
MRKIAPGLVLARVLALALALTLGLPLVPLFSCVSFAEPHRVNIEASNILIVQHHDDSDPITLDQLYNRLTLRGKSDRPWTESLHTEVHLLLEALIKSKPIGSGVFSQSGASPLYIVNRFDLAISDQDRHLILLYPDRFNIIWAKERFSLRMGRQAVGFGKTFFWNPMDWISPFTPSTIDRRYKPGADVVRFDYWKTPLSGVSLFYAAGADGKEERSAGILRYTHAMRNIDLEWLAGKVRGDLRLGYGVASTAPFLQGGALRSEGAVYMPDDPHAASFFRGTVGYDYQFQNSLRVIAEYHYNGVGGTSNNMAIQTDSHIASGEISNVGVHYAGIDVAYEITPLFRANTGGLINLVDGSLAMISDVGYSLTDETDLHLVSFIPMGKAPVDTLPRSEFGGYPTFITLSLVKVF